MRRAARDLEDYRKALEADTRSGGRKRRTKMVGTRPPGIKPDWRPRR